MTPAPDGAGDFTGMGYPCVSSAGVSFVGSTAKGGTGVFTTIGGSLRKVMDANTAYPGGGGMRLVMPPVVPTSGIKCSYPLASSGDRIVFVANDSATSRTGLFVWRDGRTARVAESGEAPCGRIIDGFDIGPEAIDGRLLAFHAFVTWNWLTPGAVPRTPYPSQVVLATLPESSAADGWRIYE
jgi:hypothetical protein